MRLIDADKLIKTLGVAKDCDDCPYSAYGFCGKSSDFVNACEAITNAPTVEPQRIKGRWLRKESDLSWWYECSKCGESPLFDPYENEVLTRFCPWCGAEMRGDEDADD